MIKELIIKNVALIEAATIPFTKGINILSGETGAGKSVILDSLNFVLGAKADKSMIRHGSDFCSVKAVFDVSKNQSVKKELDSQGYDVDDELVIFRKFSTNGTYDVKVNGESTSVSTLKKITTHLVDLHGQSEHFYLLKESNQLELIDKYAGSAIKDIKDELTNNIKLLKEINNNLNSLGGDEQQRAVKLDILNYQVNEIERIDFKENEDVELFEIKEKLQNQEKITDALNYTKQALSSEMGASDIVSNALVNINTISKISEEYSQIYERLDSLYTELNDIADTVGNMLDGFDYFDKSLDEVNERLAEIKKLKTKYGGDYQSIQTFLLNAKSEIDTLNNFDILAGKLLNQKEELSNKVYNLYIKLSELRKKSAKDFSLKVIEEVKDLNMKNADFMVDFTQICPKDSCDLLKTNGIDNVDFLFTANLGEPLKPLSKIISGGEISRFMLAIKTQTAKYNDVSTFVFDEIDAGISGETASVVAEKFIKLSKDVQLIAITHLPQIASVGDNNLLIKKVESDEKTHTIINQMSDEDKIYEVLRLIGGKKDSTTAIEHAKSLIKNANDLKNKYN